MSISKPEFRFAMIVIDGSAGEGGGQVLRTALSLSLVTGLPFRIVNIRGKRPRPGLRRQHVTAVRAAQEISSAQVQGADVDSLVLSFEPRAVQPGTYFFAIGTAGSTTLVAQTLIPALMLADDPSRITLEGGTHNPLSPPFEFFARAYLPMLQNMGVDAHATLARAGFFPAGGGRIELSVAPSQKLLPLKVEQRGRLISQTAEAVVSRLPLHIARRELAVIKRALGWPESDLLAREDSTSPGPGNVLTMTLVFNQLTEVFSGFGERGVAAETVAQKTVEQVTSYLESDAAVGTYLADQLLVPMSLSGGGSFTTVAPSGHTLTNMRVIEMFLPVSIIVHECGSGVWKVVVKTRTAY